MNTIWKQFWRWYDKHLTLNIAITTFLFLLQIIHLYWLATDVLSQKVLGYSLFQPGDFFQWMLIIVDYTEIPALFTTNILYIREYRKQKNFKSILFLIFLNIQLLHIFWITDEFVIDQFIGTQTSSHLPGWLAWIAILIDYLEVPVMFDTTKKLITALKSGKLKNIKEAFKEE
jgi:hypothetical protein